MIKFKGRSTLKQYQPMKPTKRGYKVWVRADEEGYVCQFQVYTGRVTNKVERDLGGRVVRDLLPDYLKNKGYEVYFDNFFTSVPLMKSLKGMNIYSCGTSRNGRKYFPEDFSNDKLMKRGQHEWRSTEDSLVAMKWMVRKEFYSYQTFMILMKYHL